MSASTEHAAELRTAHKQFGAVQALAGVDLVVRTGEVTVLLGPNGAGKTTAIRLLLGLARPDRGSAHLFGVDPRSRMARERIGVMMQIAKVPDMLRVREHIDTFRSYYPRAQSRSALIAAAGLDGLERRLFGTLSGGEKQRLLFALALAGNPDLLFLDEPTAGMDVETRRALWDRIRSLRADGRAVLLTTHHIEEADALADRVVVLHQGRIVADGPPDELKSRLPRRRVRCMTKLDLDEIRALDGVSTVERLDSTTIIMTPAAEDVVRILLQRDPSLSGLEVGGAALEDAFLELVQVA